MASPGNLSLGPGLLLVGDKDAPEPTTLTEAISPAWSEIGYTNEGSTFAYEFSSDPVEVAESLDPLFQKTTGRTGSVSFAMAENTVRNLTLAFNGGAVSAFAGGLAYEPPEPGEEKRRKLLWLSEDKTERWIFRQVFQSGSVSMDRRKGSDKTLIAVEFSVEKPASGARPFVALYASSRSGDNVATTPTTPPVDPPPVIPTDPGTPAADTVTDVVGATV